MQIVRNLAPAPKGIESLTDQAQLELALERYKWEQYSAGLRDSLSGISPAELIAGGASEWSMPVQTICSTAAHTSAAEYLKKRHEAGLWQPGDSFIEKRGELQQELMGSSTTPETLSDIVARNVTDRIAQGLPLTVQDIRALRDVPVEPKHIARGIQHFHVAYVQTRGNQHQLAGVATPTNLRQLAVALVNYGLNSPEDPRTTWAGYTGVRSAQDLVLQLLIQGNLNQREALGLAPDKKTDYGHLATDAGLKFHGQPMNLDALTPLKECPQEPKGRPLSDLFEEAKQALARQGAAAGRSSVRLTAATIIAAAAAGVGTTSAAAAPAQPDSARGGGVGGNGGIATELVIAQTPGSGKAVDTSAGLVITQTGGEAQTRPEPAVDLVITPTTPQAPTNAKETLSGPLGKDATTGDTAAAVNKAAEAANVATQAGTVVAAATVAAQNPEAPENPDQTLGTKLNTLSDDLEKSLARATTLDEIDLKHAKLMITYIRSVGNNPTVLDKQLTPKMLEAIANGSYLKKPAGFDTLVKQKLAEIQGLDPEGTMKKQHQMLATFAANAAYTTMTAEERAALAPAQPAAEAPADKAPTAPTAPDAPKGAEQQPADSNDYIKGAGPVAKEIAAQGESWENRAFLTDYFSRQLGLNYDQSSGIVGNLVIETGDESLPSDVKQGKGGPGRYWPQWEKERLANYRAYAEKKGVDPTDPQAQAEYIVIEFKGQYKGVLAQLRDAQNATEAAGIVMAKYEIPQDYLRRDESPELGEKYKKNLAKRTGAANEIADAFRQTSAKLDSEKPKSEKPADAVKQETGAVTLAQVAEKLRASGNFEGSQAKSDKSKAAPRTPVVDEIEAKGGSNGKLSPDMLVTVGDAWGTAQLNSSAAKAFRALDTAFYAEFGKHIQFKGEISDYRDYDNQVIIKDKKVKQGKGKYAATPGNSNHGWGLAGDLLYMDDGVTPEYHWMIKNAINYGWVHPAFAVEKDSFEPWHWEYWGPGNIEVS